MKLQCSRRVRRFSLKLSSRLHGSTNFKVSGEKDLSKNLQTCVSDTQLKTQCFLDEIFYRFDLDFQPFKSPFAASWTPLGPPWRPLGTSWALLGASWRRKRTTDTPQCVHKGSPSDAQRYKGISKGSPRDAQGIPQGFPRGPKDTKGSPRSPGKLRVCMLRRGGVREAP